METHATFYTATAARSKEDSFGASNTFMMDAHAYRSDSPAQCRPNSKVASLITHNDDVDRDDGEDEDDIKEAAAYEAIIREQTSRIERLVSRKEKRRTTGDRFIAAIRRKRRMLERNENLRFRELYKPPEPIAVLLVLVVATAVTLILTRSWPFNDM